MGIARSVFHFGLVVDGLAEYVKDASQRLRADGHGDRVSRIDTHRCRAAGHRLLPSPRSAPSYCPGAAQPQERGLVSAPTARVRSFVIDFRQLIGRKLNVYDSPQHLHDFSFCACLVLPCIFSIPVGAFSYTRLSPHSAPAPDTTSRIWVVIAGLARLVIGKGQILNKIIGVIGRIFHGYHLC